MGRIRYYMIFIYVFLIIMMSGSFHLSFLGSEITVKKPDVVSKVMGVMSEDKKAVEHSKINKLLGSLRRSENASNFRVADIDPTPINFDGVGDCLNMVMQYALYQLFTLVTVSVLSGCLTVSTITFFLDYTIKYMIIVSWFSTICVSVTTYEAFQLSCKAKCTGILETIDFIVSIHVSKSEFISHVFCVIASLAASCMSLYL